MRRGKRPAADAGPVEALWGLPAGWRWERLGKVAPVNPARDFRSLSDDDQVAFIPMASVAELSGKIALSEQRRVGSVRSGFTRFRTGDVIFAKITPCMENGKLAVIPDLPFGVGAGSTEFHVLEPSGINARYLFHWLSQETFRNRAEHNMSGTAGQKRVPADWLRAAPVPLPATVEQQEAIANRIDALFEEIDEGEAALAEGRAGVETYRKSLLKAAVTGELTADWRRQNPPPETGAELLQRILAERRARWQVDPKNARKKYAEPTMPNTAKLPCLPDGWTWASVEQLGDPLRPVAYGVLQPGEHVDDGLPLVRVTDVKGGQVNLRQLKRVSPSVASKFPRTFLSGGEVLLTVVGSIGRTAVVPAELRGANVARAVSVIAITGCRPEWLQVVLSYEPNRVALEGLAHEVARKTLNLEDVRPFPVPLPPMNEQVGIVELANRHLLDLEGIDAIGTRPSQTLRQSILAAAFRGELAT